MNEECEKLNFISDCVAVGCQENKFDIPFHLEQLLKSRIRLFDDLCELEKRLSPIMIPPSTEVEVESKPSADCALSEKIVTEKVIIDEMHFKVHRILERLQI